MPPTSQMHSFPQEEPSMQDHERTQDQLIDELNELRSRVAEVETAETRAMGIEKALRASEERWQFALEGARVGVWDWNAQTNEVFFSRQWKAMLGFEEHEIGTTLDEWDKRVHPDDKEHCYADLERHFSGEAPFYENEHRLLCKDGTYKWILDRGKVFGRGDDGKPLRVIGTHTDITDRKRLDEVLKQSEEKYRLLVENNYDIIFTLNAEGIFTFVSPAWTELLGHPTDQVIGQSFQPFVHVDDILVCLEFLQKVFNTEQKQDGVVYRVKHISGEWRWYRANAVPLKDEAGKVFGLQGIGRDFTERKRTEEALRVSEEKFRTVLDFTHDWEYWIAPDGRFIYNSPSCERITGYHPDEFLNNPKLLSTIIHPADQSIVGDYFDIIRSGDTHSMDFRIVTRTGEERWIAYDGQSVFDETGQWLGLRGSNRDITKREKLGEELFRANKNFDLFFNTIDDLLFVLDAQGGILHVNQTVLDRLGFTYAELIGQSVLDVLPLDRREEAGSIIAEMLEGKAESRPIPVFTKYGLEIPVETRVVKGWWDGKPALFCMTKDITRLKRSEEKFSTAFHSSPILMSISRVNDGYYFDVNEAFLNTMGFVRQEVIGKTSSSLNLFVDISDRDNIRRMLERDGTVRNVEVSLRRADGSPMDCLVSAEPIFLADEPCWLTTMVDITEFKRVDELLKITSAYNRSLIETSPDPLVTISAEGKITDVNTATEQFTGCSRDELIGTDFSDYFTDAERARAGYKQVLRDGSVKDYELELRHKNGLAITVLYNASLYRDESGKVMGIFAAARDITDRKRIDEDRYRRIFNNAAVGIMLVTESGRFMQGNSSLHDMLGYTEEELKMMSVFDFTFPEDIQISKEKLDDMKQSDISAYRLEKRYVRKDGALIWVDLSVSSIKDSEGRHIASIGVMSNITERKQAEKEKESLKSQLYQSQQMEAIGTLAGGFAHDFNNLLQVILAHLDVILSIPDLPEKIQSSLNNIDRAATSGAELIKGMMLLSKKMPFKLRPVDINTIVTSFESLIYRTIPKEIKIQILMAHDLPAINGDPTQIEQVLINLAINARDAMPDGGGLTIETRNTLLDEEFCRFYPDLKPGRYLLLSVTDTGKGMDQETVKHIFEPFFTTKEPGKGTGLGLSVVYGIVEKHGGKIICYSDPSVGTTFRIYFPAIEEVPV